MISHQPAGRLHSQIETGVASVANKRNGREQARLHPDDAAARGISDGQTIRIWNARGACLATADITDSVRSGVLVLPTGAWFTPRAETGLEVAGNPNVLTLDIGTSQFGQGCSAHTCLVRTEPHIADQRDAFEEYQDRLVALATA
nr:molybdopterin dinucleotide binding domain-containing protein [Tardiphaga robiniae]